MSKHQTTKTMSMGCNVSAPYVEVCFTSDPRHVLLRSGCAPGGGATVCHLTVEEAQAIADDLLDHISKIPPPSKEDRIRAEIQEYRTNLGRTDSTTVGFLRRLEALL